MNELLANLIVILVTGVILPLITAIGGYVISLINNKIKDTKLGNAIAKVEDIIESAVRNTYQTYVQKLKEQDNFTQEAQTQALVDTVNIIYNLTPKRLLELLEVFYPNLQGWFIVQIEACINKLKNE